MVNVNHLVKKIVNERSILYEALAQNIVSFANLAEKIQPVVEKELGKKVKTPAIVMALRRYSEKIVSKERVQSSFKFNTELIMKTGLSDITLVKSPSLLVKLRKVYDLINFQKGETLNVIHGNYEITIVVSEKYTQKLLELLKEENVINVEKGLVSLAMVYSKDFFYTPGVLARVSRKLLWDNINVFENISTMTELIFIVSKKDALRAYNALQELVSGD